MRADLRVSLIFLLFARVAVAQVGPPPTGKCAFNVAFDRVNSVQLPSGQRNSYLGGNIVATCPKQRIVLKSDSLEQYGDEGRLYFVGHVDYREPRLQLKSDFLTYFQKEERILATMNVDAKLPNGSTLKGPQLEFFRAIPKVRPKQRGVSLGRPTISLIEKDAKGKPQPPVNVTGNTIWLEGDSIVAASGEVLVVRPELTATGDSLYLDGGQGLLRIMRQPKIRGTKGRPFTLVGGTIDLLSRRRKLERVIAKEAAEAVSEDLNIKADTIDLRVTDDLLQRAIAWGKSRARATSPSQAITGDSIDVLMPGQRVRLLHAVRAATAEGAPDTTKFRTTDKDKLTGDTIVAHFDSLPATDTSKKPRIRQLIALGKATSYQHLPPQDTASRLPAINYVTGQVITVTFDSSKVHDVKVVGQVSGITIEPHSDSAKKAAPPGTASPSAPANRPATPPATPPANPSPKPPASPVAPPPRRP